VGAAPQLTRNKFRVAGGEPFATVVAFLRKQLALAPGDALFCYILAAFAPPPATRLEDLARAYDADGELVVHYALSSAFG
jgi:ubiquitin-like protein ATG12